MGIFLSMYVLIGKSRRNRVIAIKHASYLYGFLLSHMGHVFPVYYFSVFSEMILEIVHRIFSAPMKWPTIVMSFTCDIMEALIWRYYLNTEKRSTDNTYKAPGIRTASIKWIFGSRRAQIRSICSATRQFRVLGLQSLRYHFPMHIVS